MLAESACCEGREGGRARAAWACFLRVRARDAGQPPAAGQARGKHRTCVQPLFGMLTQLTSVLLATSAPDAGSSLQIRGLRHKEMPARGQLP